MAHQESDVRKEIESREAEFVRLINESEIDRLVETFYTDDVRLMAPDTPLAEGRDEVKGLVREMDAVYSDVDLQPEEFMISEDLAVVQGSYTAQQQTPEGDTVGDRGNYIEVFRPGAEGTWRCCMDTFTSERDPAEPGR